VAAIHSQEVKLSNGACDIVCITPHGVRVEASISHSREVIRCRYSKTTGETFSEKVVIRQFAQATNGSLAGDDPKLDQTSTDNNLEMKSEELEK
jgi:hypothetical protein